MNLYINKEEKLKREENPPTTNIYKYIISLTGCLGNLSYDSTEKEKKSQVL
jgi:hypothetical protein